MQSVMDLAKERMKQDAIGASSAVMSPIDIYQGENRGDKVFTLEIKRRRRNKLIKQILKDAGYDELASMVKVKEERI